MLAQHASRVESVDLRYVEACLKQEAGRFKGQSDSSEGRSLALRVFGSAFVSKVDEPLLDMSLFKEAASFKSSRSDEVSAAVLFAKPEKVVAAKACVCGFKALERFVVNREGVLVEVVKGRKLRIGPSTHSEFRLTLDEALGFEKRGYVQKLVKS